MTPSSSPTFADPIQMMPRLSLRIPDTTTRMRDSSIPEDFHPTSPPCHTFMTALASRTWSRTVAWGLPVR